MAFSSMTELAPGKVFAIQNSFELDGRISAYPKSARGACVSNCYLIREPDGAFLLDTGYGAHEKPILAQLASVLEPDVPLTLVPTRINEFMSVGNGMAIAERFNVVMCYSPQPDAADWLDFKAVDPGAERREIPTTLLRGLLNLDVGSAGERMIDVFSAPLRLINTTWVFDPETRILFSSDMFTHLSQPTDAGPWLIEEDRVTTSAFVRSFLLDTRYWWLEGAETGSLRRGIADVIERYDIDMIAPGYGAIFKGRELVERQFAVLDDVLRELDCSVTKPAYVPRGKRR
jgi:glyoxylase-like metal-dependent hydrolase (beta-lactamase superfamily II)